MTRPLAILGMFLVLATACNRSEPGPTAPPPPPVVKPPPPDEPEGGIKKMKQVQILVGGCRDACSEPGLAAMRFLEATAGGSGPQSIALFLDSTVLVLDGQPLGRRWVTMWKELKPATRKEDILNTARELASWTRDLSPDQVRDALTSGLKPIKVWTSEAVYRFQASGLSWKLVLKPRGLEWLVVELDRVGAPPGPEDHS